MEWEGDKSQIQEARYQLGPKTRKFLAHAGIYDTKLNMEPGFLMLNRSLAENISDAKTRLVYKTVLYVIKLPLLFTYKIDNL